MIFPDQAVRIVIATKPVDFRKGHDGLASMAQPELGLAPKADVMAVFRSKRGDRVLVRVALANKTARIVWALMARAGTYQSPAAAAEAARRSQGRRSGRGQGAVWRDRREAGSGEPVRNSVPESPWL